jgi:surface polysaccharide O-acyltransferase-like enzyme
MKRINNRDHLFDVLRIVAAFDVILLHVAAPVLTSAPNSLNWWVGNVVCSYSRWNIPIFVMISGALILNNKYESTADFYRKRLKRILIPIVFWSVFYIFWRIFKGQQLNARLILLIISKGQPYGHMWFLYMILGLYLLTPIMRAFVKIADLKLLIFAIFSFYTFGYIQSLSDIYRGFNGQPFTTLSIKSIPWFLMGFYLFQTEQKIFNNNKPFFWGGIFLLSGLAISLFTGLLFHYWGKTSLNLLNILSPLKMFMTISLAVFVKKLFTESNYRYTRLLERISSLTLGIYLIHPIWIETLSWLGISTSSITPLISIPVISLATFTLCTLSAYLLFLIPGLRRTIG